MTRRYIEVRCDHCRWAEHFHPARWKVAAKTYGWIFRGQKHFCSVKCAEAHKKQL